MGMFNQEIANVEHLLFGTWKERLYNSIAYILFLTSRRRDL